MRRKQLKRLWRRLHQLQAMRLPAGPAPPEARRRPAAVAGGVAAGPGHAPRRRPPRPSPSTAPQLRQVRRREGRYLLRTNLTDRDPAQLWELYMQLVQVEEAFKTLKGDLAVRPIHHQLEPRIEAHIFVAFLAYCAPRHAAPAPARSRARAHEPRRAREAAGDPDGRRPSPDDRRAGGRPLPVHAAGARCRAAPPAAPAHLAGAAAAAAVHPSPLGGWPNVVQTFGGTVVEYRAVSTSRTRESAKLG